MAEYGLYGAMVSVLEGNEKFTYSNLLSLLILGPSLFAASGHDPQVG